MKRLLPVGIQDFVSIREDDFCYVDKTAGIHRMITASGRAFLLSRPRRFGKSLLCSTLGALFEGKRELFNGLAIDSLEWEWKQYPVIRIDLNPGDYTEGIATLKAGLQNILENAAMELELQLRGQMASDQFGNLIMDAHRKFGKRVAIIIDEYDKPLLTTIGMRKLHENMRTALKGFYSVLKSSDAHLKFVFLTGVTKFSHVNVFSELNHFVDLTLNPRYADLCGITQEELERNFGPEIDDVLQKTGRCRKAYLTDLSRFYSGYRFSEKPVKVYNPFGLLQHFARDGEFLPYWYETGTPTFLINRIIDQRVNIVELCNMRVGYDDIRKYDIETLSAESLLYQSGYLTIADYDEDLKQFVLDYPNDEVRTSFAKSLIEQYFRPCRESSACVKIRLPRFLFKGDIDGVMDALQSFFALVPPNVINEMENFYETTLHVIFSTIGINFRSEVRIADGGIDALVETEDFVYCFEFKPEGTAEEALARISSKDYLLPWTGSGKTLFKIGVSFERGKCDIDDWKVELSATGD